MPQPYQLVAQLPGTTMQTVLRVEDQAHIPFDEANRDYQEYLEWLALGNTPDPAPTPPNPPEPEPLELPPVMPTDPNHAAPKGYVDTEIVKMRDSMTAEVAPLTERIEAIEARLLVVEKRA